MIISQLIHGSNSVLAYGPMVIAAVAMGTLGSGITDRQREKCVFLAFREIDFDAV